MNCRKEKAGWFLADVNGLARCLSLGVAIALGLMLPSAAWTGQGIAQSASSSGAIVARVPFPFFAAGRPFPAGAYRVSSRMPGILVIREVTALEEVPLSVVNVGRPRIDPHRGEATIVFALAGSRYVLSEIWLSGTRGYDVETPDSSVRVKLDDGPDPVITADARAVNLP